jgi:hypothetical protein
MAFAIKAAIRDPRANFKFYRQATDKIVGISDEAATYLGKFF